MHASDLIIHLFQRFVWLDESLQARLHERGWPDVSRSQSMVMINIVTGVTRPSDIARRLGVSRQAIHMTIAQMASKGIVIFADDPEDARHKRVVLTPFGEQMRADAQAAMAGLTEAVAARIGQARFDTLIETLATDWDGP